MSIKVLTPSNRGVDRIEITNDNGMVAEIISLGARISRLVVPSKIGDIDVVCGYDDVDGFFHDEGTYFNAIIGRVANRVGNAKFELNGKEYHLFKNTGEHSLHGGKEGFDLKIWKWEIVGDYALKMSYTSKDGEEGYPGRVDISVIYELSNDNALHITYDATTDKDTPLSMTNHAYFNFDGDFKTCHNHVMQISADKITLSNNDLITTGEFLDVKGTPWDFNSPKTIGKDLHDDALKIARGYDHNFVLNNDKINPVASVHSTVSGIKMDVYTDQPCMQLYTGNFLDGLKGKKVYEYQSAFCMETQAYPNAVNVKHFDSVILKKGEKYHSHTAYKFAW